MPGSTEALLSLLDLEPLEVNIYRGQNRDLEWLDRKSTRLNSSH